MTTRHLAVALLVLLAGCKRGGETEEAQAASAGELRLTAAQQARVQSVTIAPTTFNPAVQTTGTVSFDADQSTSVLAPISGPVTGILVQPGASVAKGQPLAYVSSPDFAAALASYRKALATARNAKRVADLDAQLFKNDAIARRELEQAQTDAVAAQADVEAAVQQLRSLGIDPAAIADGSGVTQPIQGVIRAPISGTVVERLVTPGQLLQAGTTPVFTIADLSKVWVMANVFVTDLGRVAVGDPAEITSSGAPAAFPGKVDYIAALVDPSTKATAVRIVVPNPSHFLRRDMYVNVVIRSRHQDHGLLVPVAAVLRDDDNNPFVFVDLGGGRYARRSLVLGARVGDSYVVASGISAGERVVREGGLFLQFAQSQ